MNRFKEVAKVFNLDLEEEFEAKTTSGITIELKFTEDCLLRKDGNYWEVFDHELLIKGNWEVIKKQKKPWNPEKCCKFYYCRSGGLSFNEWRNATPGLHFVESLQLF